MSYCIFRYGIVKQLQLILIQNLSFDKEFSENHEDLLNSVDIMKSRIGIEFLDLMSLIQALN